MNYFIRAYKNYANFTGRDSRKEYWMFYLMYMILTIIVSVADAMLGLNGMAVLPVVLLSIIPSIAIGARRLHDIGKTGWWQLLYLIPLLGLVPFIMLMLAGNKEENKFGPVKTEA